MLCVVYPAPPGGVLDDIHTIAIAVHVPADILRLNNLRYITAFPTVGSRLCNTGDVNILDVWG